MCFSFLLIGVHGSSVVAVVSRRSLFGCCGCCLWWRSLRFACWCCSASLFVVGRLLSVGCCRSFVIVSCCRCVFVCLMLLLFVVFGLFFLVLVAC